MTTSAIVIGQVLIILLLLIVGGVSYKIGFISEKTADQMAGFALKIVTPCVIINSFQIDYDPKKLNNMLIAAALALVTHIISIAIARLVFPSDKEGNRVRRFAAIYCNCGFMGIPLIEGAVGSEGVLYACIYVVVFQAILWSHGVVTIKGGIKNIKFYKIFVNAGTIGIAIGLPLFFYSISLPTVVSETIRHIANLNTPLAMIISGVFVAKSEIFKAFISGRNYLSVFLRHLLIPFIVMAIILFLPISKTVALTIILIAACPTASAVTLFASQYGTKNDLECASRLLTLSNILAVVTIPLVVMAYDYLSKLI